MQLVRPHADLFRDLADFWTQPRDAALHPSGIWVTRGDLIRLEQSGLQVHEPASGWYSCHRKVTTSHTPFECAHHRPIGDSPCSRSVVIKIQQLYSWPT